MTESLIPATSLDAETISARLMREGLIGLAPAAKLFGTGRGGRKKHPSTLTRYHHEGVKLADGRVVRLECLRVSSQLMTSSAAVLRFLEAQQEQPIAIPAASAPTPSPARRQRQRDAASVELDAALASRN